MVYSICDNYHYLMTGSNIQYKPSRVCMMENNKKKSRYKKCLLCYVTSDTIFWQSTHDDCVIHLSDIKKQGNAVGLTRDRRAAGLNVTRITVLCP